MTKNKALDSIPKMHTLRRDIAEVVCHLVYSGKDKEFRKTKTREIDDWLADGNFFGGETPAELAEEWLEFDQGKDNQASFTKENGEKDHPNLPVT